MQNNIQRYELTQNERIYILTTQIDNYFLKLNCRESNTLNPISYNGKFSINDLRKLSTRFNYISNIREAQELINQTIENQKVSVESLGNALNIILYIYKENSIEEPFSLTIGLNSQEDFNSLPPLQISYPKEDKSSGQEIYTTNDTYQNYQTQENYQTYENWNLNSGVVQSSNNNQIVSSLVLPLKTEQNYDYETPNQNFNQIENQTYTINETQNDNYNIANSYELPYISPVTDESKPTYLPFSSPKREQIEYVIPGSPSTAHFTFSSAPSHKNTSIETVKTTTTQQYNSVHQNPIDMSFYNQKIVELQTESTKMKQEYYNLKNESNKLNGEIGELKGQIHILLEENKILKEKNGSMPNQVQIHEINILKEENERIRKQLDETLGVKNTFDQYKILKEEEVKFLKIRIEELLYNQKKLEAIIEQNKKEIDELKRQNQALIGNSNISKTQNYVNQQQQFTSEKLKNQILTLQDTSLKVVKGSIIQTSEELELLTRKICKNNKKVTLDLLFKGTVDSDKASAFHNKCDWAGKTLVLIETTNGIRFGGYTSCSWEGYCIEKKDDNAFVFQLNTMKIYNIIPGEDAIGCYPRYGPVFLGCQIRIYDEFFKNGGTTFEKGANYDTQEDYELSGGQQKYNIKEIEVYGVQLQ